MNRLQIERFGPLIISLTVTLAVWFKGTIPDPQVVKELLAALLSAAAISAGFLTTALTVLLPIASTHIGRQLKRRNKLNELFRYVQAAIYSCIALSVVSVVGLFRLDPAIGLDRFTAIAVVALAVHAAAAFVRILEILVRVLPQMGEPEDLNG